MTTTRKSNVPAPVEAPAREVGELAIPEQAGNILSRVGAAESEWDGLDDLDMVPAAQAGIPFFRTSGKLDGGLLDAEGNQVPEVFAVLAARSLSRSYFPKSFDEDPNGRPVCWSTDGVKPAEGVPEPQAASCTGCAKSFEAGGKCRKNLEMLGYLPATDNSGEVEILRFRWGGISFAPAKRYWDSFTTRIPKKHPVAYVTRITMEPTKTDKGTFLAARFERVKELARNEVEVFIADARRRKSLWQQMIAEDVADAAAQAGDEDHRAGPFDDEPAPAAPVPAAPVSAAPVPAGVDAETGEIVRPVANQPSAGSEEMF